MKRHLLWINGKFVDSQETKTVVSPYSRKPVAEVVHATAEQLEEAIEAAHTSFLTYRRSSAYLRHRLLSGIVAGIQERSAELVDSIVFEAGKPRTLAEAEVGRAVTTFTLAAEEAKRFGGEIFPVDIDAGGRAYGPASTLWVPRGPVFAISPFNFPLNLIAHKVAPALAIGTSVLIKPPPQAPGAAALLAEIFKKAATEASDARESVPLGTLQVLSASNEVLSKAISDPRFAILSFTGSDQVGWKLQERAIRKKVVMELGGNAAVIVHNDADLARAAARCAWGAFAYAGQICISVQRIFVQKTVEKAFEEAFSKQVSLLKVGDPNERDTLVGPLIDQANADRIWNWIEEARAEGATTVCGGDRSVGIVYPAVLKNVSPTSKLSTEEAFGPVATLSTYGELSEAIAAVNSSRFGLQAGVFTESARVIRQVTQDLDVGGLLINEVPTFRADPMPYGGMKESGLGREGVKYAMREYCEPKTVIEWRG